MSTQQRLSADEQQLIAGEILNQLGGNKFIVMTGSKNLGFSEEKENAVLSFERLRI